LIIDISVLVIALAFAVLVGYLVVTLKAASRSLNQVQETLVRLEKQVDDLSQESVKLIQTTNLLTEDVHRKVRTLDSLFQSANQVGDAVHEVTTSVKQVSAALSSSFAPRVEKTVRSSDKQVSEIMQWVSLTMGFVQKVKGLRSARNTSVDE
jgi:uncharacterized protein YoxC